MQTPKLYLVLPEIDLQYDGDVSQFPFKIFQTIPDGYFFAIFVSNCPASIIIVGPANPIEYVSVHFSLRKTTYSMCDPPRCLASACVSAGGSHGRALQEGRRQPGGVSGRGHPGAGQRAGGAAEPLRAAADGGALCLPAGLLLGAGGHGGCERPLTSSVHPLLAGEPGGLPAARFYCNLIAKKAVAAGSRLSARMHHAQAWVQNQDKNDSMHSASMHMGPPLFLRGRWRYFGNSMQRV